MEFTPGMYEQLRVEVEDDPAGMGYAVHADKDALTVEDLEQIAELLSRIPPKPAAVLVESGVSASDFMARIDLAEWRALPAEDRGYIDNLLRSGTVIATAAVADTLSAMFATAPLSRTRLLALLRRPLTRAEELFGKGVEVRQWHVGRAFPGHAQAAAFARELAVVQADSAQAAIELAEAQKKAAAAKGDPAAPAHRELAEAQKCSDNVAAALARASAAHEAARTRVQAHRMVRDERRKARG
jgi:hypothetical protein